MSFHIEWHSGTGRLFDDGLSYTHADPFFSVLSLRKIGPDTVFVEADLTQRKLKKSDISDIYSGLRDAGFIFMQCWRKVGKKLPRGAKSARIIRQVGELVLWEVEL